MKFALLSTEGLSKVEPLLASIALLCAAIACMVPFGCNTNTKLNTSPFANAASETVASAPIPTPTAVSEAQLMKRLHNGILDIKSDAFPPGQLGKQAQLDLVRHLKAAPHIRRLRAAWHWSGPGLLVEGVALYDRQSKTLRYYHLNSWYGEGGDSEHPNVKHLLFSGVTEEILEKMAQKDALTEVGAGDGFVNLASYGCAVTKLR